MRGFVSAISIIVFLLGYQISSVGQESFLPTEEQLIETQWNYEYATHPESGNILHQGGEGFEYFVYFKFDQSYVALLNKERYVGKWAIDGIQFQFSFNGVSNFRIHQLTEEKLVLLYESEYTGQQMYYHFSAIAPMDSPINEMERILPKVTVDEALDRNKEKSWFAAFIDKLFNRYTPPPEPYIKIELTGGGFYGGLNRVIKDYIIIDNRGQLILEIMSLDHGTRKFVTEVEREELLRFAEFVSAHGFFDMPRVMGCSSKACDRRLHEKPTPIPMRLSITYGERRNIVTVPIWGKEAPHGYWIKPPSDLEAIVFAIQNMAHSRI